MKKSHKIIYWVATLWLSLGMLSTGVVQLIGLKEETAFIIALGYPAYLLPFLGISKIAAVAVLLLPRLPLLKEWAYAGLCFTMLGALYSHIATGSGFIDMFGPVLLLILIFTSRHFRPESRKTAQA